MKLFQTTKKWVKYWSERKINWRDHYVSTYNHPHRHIISSILSQFNWGSLMEIGVGAGANLINIVKKIPGKQLGGIDVSADAIKTAEECFTGGYFKVGGVEDIPMSDNATDVILSDMCLIYLDPRTIDKAMSEIKRVARNYIVFCEFHHNSWFKRLKLRLTSGYFAYNYKTLLEKHGFYDIIIRKLPPESWENHDPQKTYAYIITARVPKRKFNNK